MNRFRYTVIFLVFLFICVNVSGAKKAHVHGEAQSSMIFEADEVKIEIIIPADSVVGSEGPFTTKEERNKILLAKENLAKDEIFVFYRKKGIFKKTEKVMPKILNKSVELISDDSSNTDEVYKNNQKHGHKDKHSHENHQYHHSDKDKHQDEDTHHNDESHAEFLIKYHFELTGKLDSIKTDIFTRLPNLEVLKLNLIKQDQQRQFELNPEKNKLNLMEDKR